MSPADRDNLVRFRPTDRAGHVESYFLKANAPEGGRAFWLKFTILAPIGRPAEAVAEVWAIVFDGASGEHVAGKETFPVAEADFRGPAGAQSPERFRFAAGPSLLEEGWTRGRVRAGDRRIEWDLRFTEGAPPLHLFPSDALYETRGFPTSKQLTPHPDSRFTGHIAIDGAPLAVEGWPGMQGHNWGRGHAFRYAWAHVNAFAGAPGTYFEGASAKVKIGPIATPFMTLLYLRHAGREYDFRGVRHWLNRSVAVGRTSWSFTAENEHARLAGRLEARPADFVGLVYRDPGGAAATCLNSKIARCRLDLSLRAGPRFEPAVTLTSESSAALELLVREPDPGFRVYA